MSNSNKISLIGLIVWLICGAFFMYEYLLRTILGTFEKSIMKDLNLDFVTFAILSSTAYLLVYAIMQIPAGLITDRFGLKKTMVSAVMIAGIAVLGFSMSQGFGSALIFRLMTGFGCAFGFICLLVAVYEWMPHKHIGLFIGLSQFIGTMGPMVAAGPLDSLAQNSPGAWREVFFGLFVIGSIIAIFGLFFVKNNKPQTGSFQILSPYTSWKDDLADLFKQKQVWCIALYAATVYFVIEYLSENSGIKYMELNGIGSDIASYMITLSWIGYAVGCPILGSISDRTGRRKNVMIAAAICGIISTAVIIYLPISAILLMIAFFGMGVGASGQSISFATIAERCNSRYRAAGLGLNNGVMLAFVSFSAPLIGYILSLVTQSGQSPTVADYQQAFIFIIGFMAVSLFASIFLVKETYCKSTRETTILETR